MTDTITRVPHFIAPDFTTEMAGRGRHIINRILSETSGMSREEREIYNETESERIIAEALPRAYYEGVTAREKATI